MTARGSANAQRAHGNGPVSTWSSARSARGTAGIKGQGSSRALTCATRPPAVHNGGGQLSTADSGRQRTHQRLQSTTRSRCKNSNCTPPPRRNRRAPPPPNWTASMATFSASRRAAASAKSTRRSRAGQGRGGSCTAAAMPAGALIYVTIHEILF